MRHRSAPRDLGPALEGLMARVEPQTPLARLQRVWPEAVGPALAPHATPTAMTRDGVVSVACDAGVWAQELDLLAPEVLARIDALLGPGTARELRCRATETPAWARSRRPGRKGR